MGVSMESHLYDVARLTSQQRAPARLSDFVHADPTRQRRAALLASCAILAAMLVPHAPARGANDGVIFDGATTNNGIATGAQSFAISASGGIAATASGGFSI